MPLRAIRAKRDGKQQPANEAARVAFLLGLDDVLTQWALIANQMNHALEKFEGSLGAVWFDLSERTRADLRRKLAALPKQPTQYEGGPVGDLVEAFAVLDTGRQAQLLNELRSGEFEKNWAARQ
jgi:hypothetical protein